MRTLVLLWIGILLTCASSSARADDETAANLLRRGVELRRRHQNEEALQTFARALAISSTPTARAQVALAEQALGRWLEAERDLVVALAATDDAWIAMWRSALVEARTEIEKHLAWLTVKVDIPGADVQIDGVAMTAASEQRVVSGPAVLEVRAIGYAPDIRHVDLKPGLHAHIAVALAPLVAQSPPFPAQAVSAPSHEVASDVALPARRGGFPVATPILATVGLVGIAVGTYFGLRTFADKTARDAQCPLGACTPAALQDDSDARTSATLATVSIGAGVASVAAGAAWWLLDSQHASEDASRRRLRPVGPPLMAGIGLAGVGVGTYFGILTFAQRGERDSQCRRGVCTTAALAYDADARRSATLATVTVGAGLASLAGGLMWWLNGGEHARRVGSWHARPLVDARTWGVVIERGAE
jgi:xanthosine utilization system XapX-like protein